MDPFYYYYAVVLFLFGLVFGSFLNVCIYRLPRDLSVVSPGSACPECKHPIAWRDNIPVFGWLLLRGKCRYCAKPITPRYAVVELTTGLLFLFCFTTFGGPGPTLSTIKACVFCFLILGLIFTDLENFLLPDKLTLPGLAIGLLFSWFVPLDGLLERFLFGTAIVDGHLNLTTLRWLSVGDAAIGAGIGAGFIYFVGEAYFRIRGIEGMGFGDVKLMAMIGAFLGLEKTLFVLFLASIAGSFFGIGLVAVRFSRRLSYFRSHHFANAVQRARKSASAAMRHQEMPFGVFLGGAALIALFYAEPLVRWYSQQLR